MGWIRFCARARCAKLKLEKLLLDYLTCLINILAFCNFDTTVCDIYSDITERTCFHCSLDNLVLHAASALEQHRGAAYLSTGLMQQLLVHPKVKHS